MGSKWSASTLTDFLSRRPAQSTLGMTAGDPNFVIPPEFAMYEEAALSRDEQIALAEHMVKPWATPIATIARNFVGYANIAARCTGTFIDRSTLVLHATLALGIPELFDEGDFIEALSGVQIRGLPWRITRITIDPIVWTMNDRHSWPDSRRRQSTVATVRLSSTPDTAVTPE